MSMWSMPSGFSASRMAPITAGGAPVAPASPAPFTPSGLGFAGTSGRSQTRSGENFARGTAGAHELALGIEHDRFHQRLADALGDAAVDLAFAEQVIHDLADVVNRGVAGERH